MLQNKLDVKSRIARSFLESEIEKLIPGKAYYNSPRYLKREELRNSAKSVCIAYAKVEFGRINMGRKSARLMNIRVNELGSLIDDLYDAKERYKLVWKREFDIKLLDAFIGYLPSGFVNDFYEVTAVYHSNASREDAYDRYCDGYQKVSAGSSFDSTVFDYHGWYE